MVGCCREIRPIRLFSMHAPYSIAAFLLLIVVSSSSLERNEKPDSFPVFDCDADDDSPEWPWVANIRGLELTEDVCAERTKAWVDEQLQRLQAWKAAVLNPNGTHSATSSDDTDFGPLNGFGAGRQSLKPLLFFLHVPRTGGRTFHACFLKPLFPQHQRCPRSYDVLRLDPANPACRLLASHDDYSLLSRLPAAQTSVLSHVRSPVERVLSAYEFAVELAGRSLGWRLVLQRGETLLEKRRSIRKRMMGNRAETRRVWPWTFFIPFLENDIWRKHSSSPIPADPAASPYEQPHIVMSLEQFVRHPAALDLLHNGAVFQLAGVTQNSVEPQAAFLRHCSQRFPQRAGQHLLRLAKARLAHMLHVGLTEAHEESAVLLAAVLGRSLHSRAHVLPGLLPPRPLNSSSASGNVSAQQEKAAHTLLATYRRCVQMQRRKEGGRRKAVVRSLSLSFSQETRQRIPASALAAIRALNPLDEELLDFARQVFRRRQLAYAAVIRAVAEPLAASDGAARGGGGEAANGAAPGQPLQQGATGAAGGGGGDGSQGTAEAGKGPQGRRRRLQVLREKRQCPPVAAWWQRHGAGAE